MKATNTLRVLLSLPDVAAMLDHSLSSIQKKVAKGTIPSLLVGRRRLVEASAISELIQAEKDAEALRRSAKGQSQPGS